MGDLKSPTPIRRKATRHAVPHGPPAEAVQAARGPGYLQVETARSEAPRSRERGGGGARGRANIAVVGRRPSWLSHDQGKGSWRTAVLRTAAEVLRHPTCCRLATGLIALCGGSSGY
jgi:hypothetical protein